MLRYIGTLYIYLQVAGMFVTYFVLLVQFKPSEDSTIQLNNKMDEMRETFLNLTQLMFNKTSEDGN